MFFLSCCQLDHSVYLPDHSKLVRPRVARLLGKGLGWIEGEDEHKRMRKMASPSFSCVSCLTCHDLLIAFVQVREYQEHD